MRGIAESYSGSVGTRHGVLRGKPPYLSDMTQMSAFRKLHFALENAIEEKEVRPEPLSSEVARAVSPQPMDISSTTTTSDVIHHRDRTQPREHQMPFSQDRHYCTYWQSCWKGGPGVTGK